MQVNSKVLHRTACDDLFKRKLCRKHQSAFRPKCENWSVNARKQHPFIAGQFILPSFFMHWLSVSLYRASPLYSFSQKLHTEEREIMRRRVSSPSGTSASVLSVIDDDVRHRLSVL